MSGIWRWQEPVIWLAAALVFSGFLMLWLATLLCQQPLAPQKFISLSAPHATFTPANTEDAEVAGREPGVVYVSDIYVPGHARAHPELCPDQGAQIQLLILVTSAPSHASARDAVRLTWGHFRARSDIAIAFVLGQAPPALQADLVAEDELYGDLIIGNSIDSYFNLTLKTISILEWTLEYCSRASYLLKTDDDMFINVPRLLSHIENTSTASLTMWGRFMHNHAPNRLRTSKFFISKQDWADPIFPDYAMGAAYLMTIDCVRPLLGAACAPLRRYLFLEDVFVTGVLATELGIQCVVSQPFLNQKLAITSHPCIIRRTISVHNVPYHEQFELWRMLLDGTTECIN